MFNENAGNDKEELLTRICAMLLSICGAYLCLHDAKRQFVHHVELQLNTCKTNVIHISLSCILWLLLIIKC